MNKVKESFSEVYENNYSYVYNFVYMQVMHRETAEDLVSDIFMKAMTHYDGFDPNKASVKTWICNIARNTVIDYYRKNSKRQSSSLDEEGAVEPSYMDEYASLNDDVNKEVYALLCQLSQEERELLSMIYGQKMKILDIGNLLGITAKAVSGRHRRLLQKCRFLLKGKDASDFFDF